METVELIFVVESQHLSECMDSASVSEVWTAGIVRPPAWYSFDLLSQSTGTPAKGCCMGGCTTTACIHRGVGAELQQLRPRPSLTQVSCPYSADKLPQLRCYLKPSPCCPWRPEGLTEEDGAPFCPESSQNRPPPSVRLNLSRKWINNRAKRAKYWQVWKM